MDIIEEYKKSSDKINFFSQQDLTHQKEIIVSLSNNEKSNLLSGLSFTTIERLLREFSIDSKERRDIIVSMSRDSLMAIYRNANQDEQESIRKELAGIQGYHELFIGKQEKRINDANHNIDKANIRIDKANNSIVNSNIKINSIKEELKQNRIVLKKISKERSKLLNKKNKLSMKKNSRLGIINKRRINKLRELTDRLEQLSIDRNSLDHRNDKLRDTIQKEKENIIQQRNAIDIAKDVILNANKEIEDRNLRIKKANVSIRNLTDKEKYILNRKIYKKQVDLKNDYIFSRKKKNKDNKSNVQDSSTQSIDTNKDIQDSTKKDSQQDNKKNNTSIKQKVDNVGNVVNNLVDNGLNILPNNVPLISSNSNDLLNQPVITISREQYIILLNSLQYLSQIIQQQLKDSQLGYNQSNGRSRTLSHNGIGSISIMVFIISIAIIISVFFIFFH